MDTIFMNSKNSGISDLHRLLLNLTDKINLKRSDKYVVLYLSITINTFAFTINGKNIKKSYKDNKFKISTPTWNEEFELPDGSYCVSDIHDYFECILKTWRKD